MNHATLKVLIAQINPTVGAVSDNEARIIETVKTTQANHHLIVFPELALVGYPPEDLLYRKELHQQVAESIKKIQAVTTSAYVVLGHPSYESKGCYNTLSILHQGQMIRQYHKQKPPNYGVFDEARYFIPGPPDPCVLRIEDQLIGFLICEDLWQEGPGEALLNAGVSTIISLNASPFDYDKYAKREALVKRYALNGVNVLYINLVGGQDELLFDGQSFGIDKQGALGLRCAPFKEELTSITLTKETVSGPIAPLLDRDPLIYEALVYGVSEYVQKNKFPGVLVGLSGGVDSALTLAIAVDALGADNVHAVMMPSCYTSSISNEDALQQIKALDVAYSRLPIDPIVQMITSTLAQPFNGLPHDVTEENIQARIRGLLLMALSNKTGKMLLTTSNKSESAVGYATLYGDMAGGFSVLKDVLKTQVYAIAQYRTSLSPVIPERVITRPPSAELRANQKDQDSLPDYPILDALIVGYMEYNLTAEELVKKGYDSSLVNQVIQLIKRNEYKRRQSAPGIKISPVAFGKDWRYPITNGLSTS